MTTIRLSLAPLFLVLVAGSAAADDACPRTPAWGQVPNVWDPAPAEVCGGAPCVVTQMRARSDGRWAGAAQVPLSNGDAGGRVRFLEGTDGALYASLEIETTAADREVFWFGWAPSNATDAANAWLLEVSVRPYPNASNPETQEINQKVIGCDAPSCPAGETCTPAPRAARKKRCRFSRMRFSQRRSGGRPLPRMSSRAAVSPRHRIRISAAR